ncbi:hypothetical protein Tco_0273782 [Tanacetum coccineum]
MYLEFQPSEIAAAVAIYVVAVSLDNLTRLLALRFSYNQSHLQSPFSSLGFSEAAEPSVGKSVLAPALHVAMVVEPLLLRNSNM